MGGLGSEASASQLLQSAYIGTPGGTPSPSPPFPNANTLFHTLRPPHPALIRMAKPIAGI